jgi:hypothetical protein
MQFNKILLFLLCYSLTGVICHAQNIDSLYVINGYVCDETINPLPYSHIINLRDGRGCTSGLDGNFCLNAFLSDTILIRNLSYEDIVIAAGKIQAQDTLIMKIRYYQLKEVKIFEWGSTYADFKAKMKSMPVTENWGEKLKLPQQKGNPLPNFRNPDALSNPIFAITNPVDFLYFNLNKKQQSIQKVIEFQQNEDLIRRFESIYNRSSISALTGLSGDELDKFLINLNLKFNCDFNCSEIQIVEEIYKFWKEYCEKNEKIGLKRRL